MNKKKNNKMIKQIWKYILYGKVMLIKCMCELKRTLI